MRWFTSDLHLGHLNILRYCPRPYDTVDDMNADLIARWNAHVADTDDVWVLGDLCLGKLDDSLQLLSLLNGTIHLLVGNHDRPFRQKGRETSERRYLDAGIATVSYGTTTTTIGDQQVLCCHFPYHGDSHDEHDRYPELRPDDRGQYLLHGHQHGIHRMAGRQIDVGVDAWGGAPVSETTIAELIAHGPADLPPLPWER
jgi:calcineurin-like phosphoesterase family protein